MQAWELVRDVQEFKPLGDRNIVVEINGRTDHDITAVYVDGSGTLCIAIKLDEDYKKYL